MKDLYHLSPMPKLIWLDPVYARGRRKVIWLVDLTMLAWALKHVGKHQKTPWLYCYRVRVHHTWVKEVRPGVYIMKRRLRVLVSYPERYMAV